MSEYIRLNDPVKFGVVTSSPSGGAVTDADETPRWMVFEELNTTPILQGNFSQRTGFVGNYIGAFHASGVSGFDQGNYYEVVASGKVAGIVGFDVVKTFVVGDYYDVNVVQVSGSNVHINDFKYSPPSIYYADVKLVRDSTAGRDEIGVGWFKNAQPVASSQITNPAVSMYRTNDSSAIFENAILSYNSFGSLRYNHSALVPSGEPFLVITSGTIDSSTREWRRILGHSYGD